MTSQRRYGEQEIAAIFEHAAAAQEKAKRQLTDSEGLTLSELQEIGRNAGITPEFIAHAAAAVGAAQPDRPPVTYFGFPVTVSRTVELPRPVTDEEWERIVVDLRETFRAQGVVQRDGSTRHWRNGNLHALVEPSESGHRLRLGSFHANARNALFGGLAALAFGLMMFVIAATSGKLSGDDLILAFLALAGLGAFGYTGFSRLPRWVNDRQQQMDAIAQRALGMVAGSAPKMPAVEQDRAPELDLDELSDPAGDVSRQSRRRTRS